MAVIKYRDSSSGELKKLNIPIPNEVVIGDDESTVGTGVDIFIDESMDYGKDTIVTKSTFSKAKVYTGQWIANSSNSLFQRVTEEITIQEGVYLAIFTMPVLSNTQATMCICDAANPKLPFKDQYLTGASGNYKQQILPFETDKELTLYGASGVSTSMTYTYISRGSLIIIKLG